MVTGAIAFLALMQSPSAAPPSFDYSGIPTLTSTTAQPLSVRVVSHSVTIEIGDRDVRVSSVTQFRNAQRRDAPIRVFIPRRRMGDENSGPPSFAMNATWDKSALPLGPREPNASWRNDGPVTLYTNDLAGTAALKAEGTHAVRVNYTVPLGRTGLGQKMRILGYSLGGTATQVETLDVSLKNVGGTIFKLPEMRPRGWRWQVGERGAYIRHRWFTPKEELVTASFYPDGFEDIGN